MKSFAVAIAFVAVRAEEEVADDAVVEAVRDPDLAPLAATNYAEVTEGGCDAAVDGIVAVKVVKTGG